MEYSVVFDGYENMAVRAKEIGAVVCGFDLLPACTKKTWHFSARHIQ